MLTKEVTGKTHQIGYGRTETRNGGLDSNFSSSQCICLLILEVSLASLPWEKLVQTNPLKLLECHVVDRTSRVLAQPYDLRQIDEHIFGPMCPHQSNKDDNIRSLDGKVMAA